MAYLRKFVRQSKVQCRRDSGRPDVQKMIASTEPSTLISWDSRAVCQHVINHRQFYRMKMPTSKAALPSDDGQIIERALLSLLCPTPLFLTPPVETSFKEKMRRERLPAARKNHQAEWIPLPARIVVQEILSAHTLSISWSDSQTGHYAEQIWRLGLARDDGFCALSGRPIVRGDEVFRPRRSMTLVPANWRRMILASDVIATFASTQLDRAAA